MRTTLVILMLVCFGCDQSTHASPSAAPASVVGNGIIHGNVKFLGTPPVMKSITATDACCKDDPQLQEETVIVNPNGTLRNVFVYLEDGPRTNGSLKPAAILDQSHCQFVPHAIGVQVGQPLRVHSSDATLHNVHYVPSQNSAGNLSMPAAGAEAVVRFDYAEFIRVKCDVHPWMTGWVGVFETPFYTVTRDEGSFEIKGIPAGTYKLVAWHELYGRREQTVTVTDGSPATVDFSYGKAEPTNAK